MKITGAIVGGAGYTGGELLRLSLSHPNLEITQILSKSQSGTSVPAVHRDLIGEVNLKFQETLQEETDVLFLCRGHGQSLQFVDSLEDISAQKIVDLSHDFRLVDPGHSFQYGLPEAFRDSIQTSLHIANPGCFATAIQLGLLPLVDRQRLTHDVHVHSITGSTGAGQSLKATTHFTWRHANISTYKVFEHQHLAEIYQTLKTKQPSIPSIHFVPMRGPFARGIYSSIYTHFDGSEGDARELYEAYYRNHPFVHLTDSNPDLKQIVNTNKCVIHVQKKGDFLYIISMIDNLLKGAVGQAIQNMNLIFGLDETTGLILKSTAF